jgi:hypothetical protein
LGLHEGECLVRYISALSPLRCVGIKINTKSYMLLSVNTIFNINDMVFGYIEFFLSHGGILMWLFRCLRVLFGKLKCAKVLFKGTGVLFTKLTCVSDVTFGKKFSIEIHTILCSYVIVFTFECQAWITMVDIKQKYLSNFFL